MQKQILIPAITLAIILSSCIVSKKKYMQLQADKNKTSDSLAALSLKYTDLTNKFDSLMKRYRDLEKKNKDLFETCKDEQTKLDTELQRKTNALRESNKKISDMQALMDKQKAASEELLAKIKNALLGFNSDELTVEMKDGKVYVSLSEKLLFKSGSAVVDKKGKEALAKVGEVLAKQTDIDIMVEGHTDNVPLKGQVIKDNWDLSVLRATSITRILTQEYKVSPKQVIPSGRADNFPISDNTTAEGRAKNRRTEIILAPKISELIKIIESNQ
jgi:chemotaxis protein MotB